jgi:mRNA interferase MazF
MSAVLMERTNKIVRKDEVWLADLGTGKGSIQGGLRPVLITTNDMGCKYSSVIQVASITSSKIKKSLPTHVCIDASENGFEKDSTIMFEQLFPLIKEDLKFKLFDLPSEYYDNVDRAYIMAAKRSERYRY